MGYTDSIDASISSLDKEIRRLQKIKREYKAEKQIVCPHVNVTRYAKMQKLPSMSQYFSIDPDTPVNFNVITKCNDCGKVLK